MAPSSAQWTHLSHMDSINDLIWEPISYRLVPVEALANISGLPVLLVIGMKNNNIQAWMSRH